MPIIDFHGKKAIQNYEPPFHLLEEDMNLSFQSKVPGNSRDNILIEGDNLLALKALLPEYAGRIKCIYIDPPYNTNNKDWVYCDNIEITSKNDPAWQQVEKFLKDGNEIDYNDPSRHSKWLCMMYPRLRLLHQLLSDYGVIFISIDDNEVHHLRTLLDEIFGEQNFVGNLIWQSRTSISNDREISLNHNHTLVYSSNRDLLIFRGEELDEKEYKNPDNDARGKWKPVPLDANKPGGDTKYGIKNPNTGKVYYPPNERSWAMNERDFNVLLSDGRIMFGVNGDSAPKKKLFWMERKQKDDTKTPSSLLLDAGTTKDGTAEIVNLFGSEVFDYPKPSSLIKRLIGFGGTRDCIIMDSFSGSGTTAQAVMDLNAEDGGIRKFILVQIPEEIKESKPAYEKGYRYVHEITRERMTRIANGYMSNEGVKITGLGGGFRYYRLSTPLFTKERDDIVSNTTWQQLAPYLYFTEFKQALEKTSIKKPFVGYFKQTSLYLIYKEPQTNCIDEKFVAKLVNDGKKKIVYADYVDVDDNVLDEAGITFRQIPYDIFYI